MIYQERSISPDTLEKFLTVLDSDEGIRIDNKTSHIFINKTSKRYCINISNNNNDEFVYRDSVKDVINFLKNMITPTSKIVAY
jgi:hypothetical protein